MRQAGFILLAILCMGAEGQCNACDVTRATKCQEYTGDATAVSPYMAEPTVTVDRHSNEWGTVLAHVWLHNPTALDATADVSCEFYLDDWHAGDNSIQDVTVCAESSVYSELQYGGDFQDSAEAGVICVASWR